MDKADTQQAITTVGQVEVISFPELGMENLPARIDTGAKTSSVWASNIYEKDGILHYSLLGESHELFTGQAHHAEHFEKTVVVSSNGVPQERYKIVLLMKLKGKKIRGKVTLADRSAQVYPVLVGRNVLRGKFIVDVKQGKPLYHEERQRSRTLGSGTAQEG